MLRTKDLGKENVKDIDLMGNFAQHSENIIVSNPNRDSLSYAGAIFRKVKKGNWVVMPHYQYDDAGMVLKNVIITHESKIDSSFDDKNAVNFGPVVDDSGVLRIFDGTYDDKSINCDIKTGNEKDEVYQTFFTHSEGSIDHIKLIRLVK